MVKCHIRWYMSSLSYQSFCIWRTRHQSSCIQLILIDRKMHVNNNTVFTCIVVINDVSMCMGKHPDYYTLFLCISRNRTLMQNRQHTLAVVTWNIKNLCGNNRSLTWHAKKRCSPMQTLGYWGLPLYKCVYVCVCYHSERRRLIRTQMRPD